MTTIVSPQPQLTSTSTGKASIPWTSAVAPGGAMARQGGGQNAGQHEDDVCWK
jgi:hypothetical protein